METLNLFQQIGQEPQSKSAGKQLKKEHGTSYCKSSIKIVKNLVKSKKNDLNILLIAIIKCSITFSIIFSLFEEDRNILLANGFLHLVIHNIFKGLKMGLLIFIREQLQESSNQAYSYYFFQIKIFFSLIMLKAFLLYYWKELLLQKVNQPD